MHNEKVPIDDGQMDLRLSDDELESAVGGLRQPRGPAKLKAFVHRHGVHDSLSQPSNVKIEVSHD